VALVTGAAKRLGQAIALALARRGWDVAVHYHHSAQDAQTTVDLIRAMGQRAMAFSCDLADSAAVTQLVPQALAGLGGLHCVVNNASRFEYDSALDFTPQQLDIHMRTNLVAPVLLAQGLHAATKDGGQAVVVNLLDQKLGNMNPDYFSYTLSKAALENATVMLAQALAPKLRVAGVAPGISLPSPRQTLEQFAVSHRMTPLGRSSTPDDIAAAVCFIVETPGITGTTIVVDGGQHLVPLARDVVFVAPTAAT
jgi:NAD(P)-dependent dehydrogenase (short-subunit alcohol dehydrogenase family)